MLIAFVAGAYVVSLLGFGLASLARSWRTLAVAAAAASGGFVAAFALGDLILGDGGVPMSYLAVLVYVSPFALFVLSVSAAFGVITRGVGLALRRAGGKPSLLGTSSIVGFIVLNVVFVSLFVALPTYIQRPLSEACLGATFKIEVGGRVLAVPSAPYVFARRSPTAGDNFVYSLDSNAQVRELCERTNNGAAVLQATSVALHVGWGDDLIALWPSYCRRRDLPGWDQEICRQDNHEAPDDWPHSIIFHIEEDGFLTSYNSPRVDFERYFGESGAAEGSGGGLRVGMFEKHETGNISFWLSDDPTLTLPDGQPFIAECHSECSVVFEEPPGLVVEYQFYLNVSGDFRRETRIRAAHAAAMEVIDGVLMR